MEESKVERALECGLGKVQPSPGLLDRITGEAEKLGLPTAPRRPGLWKRLRLGPKLEVAAACLLFLSLVGYAVYRNLNPIQAPAGGERPAMDIRNSYTVNGQDAVLQVLATLEPTEEGGWLLSSTITNLSRSEVYLAPECGGLVRVEGRTIKAVCGSETLVPLAPSVSRREEVRFSAGEIRNPTAILVAYSVSGDDMGHTLRIPLAQGTQPEGSQAAMRALVEDFGRKLQNVSLQSPPDVLRRSLQENFGDLVTPELLAQWQSDPQQVPARATSSPWPDRIEINSVEKRSESQYAVQGDIIEVTSVEKVSGGAAAKRPVTLAVEKRGDRWLISDVTLGEYAQPNPEPVRYSNTDFGFNFVLPATWQGYTILTEQWEGTGQGGNVVQTGPMLSIRHPRWTKETPRQDIPIMIFTLAQWDALQKGEFHIGAAPVNPSELGRNKAFVFALPARYNFAFPTGYEEVEEILKGNPLHAID